MKINILAFLHVNHHQRPIADQYYLGSSAYQWIKKPCEKKICLVHALNFYVKKSATSFFCPQVILNICLMNKLCPNGYFALQNDHYWWKSNKNEFVNFFGILTGLMMPSPLTRGGRRLLIFENNPGGLNTFVWRWKGATLLRLG